MDRMLKPGIEYEEKRVVSERDAITFLGDAVQPSLSTPSMINWMEFAARDGVKSHLDPGQDTVGTRVEVEHLAATPLGAEVTYRSKLVAVEGRRLTFEIEAADAKEVVGRGRHERHVIDVERFAAGLRKRFAGMG